MHVRLLRHRVGTRPDSPDRVALGDHPALVDEQRAQLPQRHGVPVGRPDRHDPAAARHEPCEGDRAPGRGANLGAELGADVHAAMLAACVRIVAEREPAQHRAPDRPRPGTGRRGEGECEGEDDEG
jgi:hypothetical protein